MKRCAPESRLSKFGRNMDWFKKRVEALLESEEPEKLYRVQIGAFRNRKNAEAYADKAREDGYKAFIVEAYKQLF